MITVTTAIISNEWFFTYNSTTKEVIVTPNFVDANTSAIVGENVVIKVAQTEKELLDLIKKLGLIIPKSE